jgi:hypothetical protein
VVVTSATCFHVRPFFRTESHVSTLYKQAFAAAVAVAAVIALAASLALK